MDINSEPPEIPPASPGSGWIAGGLILCNTLVGGGLLNLPASIIATGGFASGLSILFLMLGLACISHMALGWCSDLQKTNSYQETVAVLLGEWGRIGAAIVVFGLMYIGDIYLFVGMSDMIERVLIDTAGKSFYCNSEHWYVQRTFVSFLILVVIIFPLCLFRYIDKLKYISGCATFSILYVVGVVIYEYYSPDSTKQEVPIGSQGHDWPKVFLAVPGLAIAYANHFATISVYSRLEPRNIKTLLCSVGLAEALATMIYITTIIYVCLLYGESVNENFISSFSTTNWGVRFGFIFYALKLSLEYPAVQFVGWTCIESFFQKFFPNLCQTDRSERIRRIAVSVVWLSTTFLIGTFLPSLAYFSTITSVFSLLIMLFIPGLCMVHGVLLHGDPFSLKKKYLLYAIGVFITAIGTFLIGVVLVQFGNIVASSKHSDCD